MKNKIVPIALLLSSIIIFSQAAICQSPAATTSGGTKRGGRPEITGQFDLQEGAKAKDRTLTSIDESITFLESLSSKITSLAGGNISTAESATPDALNYMSVAYLLCSVDNGVCPMYLDSLLEADVINGRINKSDECPNLKGFWAKYIANDLENRFRFMSKLGNVSKTTSFNENQRPKYIRCKDTVKVETTGTMSDNDFFRIRYKDSTKLDAIKKSLEAVRNYKEKKINVFGILSASGK